mmetsp:Transcript_18798/g.52385  ORF Transcript_18798/g.52385 Transcript_18798/m.52385 type:complete len:526 (-) Transcript_18798:154-1731(-)
MLPGRVSCGTARNHSQWILLLLLGLAHLANGSRQLKSACHSDKCGVYCGPPRPPPCGDAAPQADVPDYHRSPDTPAGEGYPALVSSQTDDKPQSPSSDYSPVRQPQPDKELASSSRSYDYPPLRPSQPDGRTSTGPPPNTSYPPLRPSTPPAFPSGEKERGCFGEIPFGLENCVCEGADVGQVAGMAACGRVFTECEGLVPFGLQDADSGALAAVQRVCDTFALDSCVAAAGFAVTELPGCEDLLQFGTPKCTPRQAMAIFRDSVNRQCDPICTDCVRHKQLPPFKSPEGPWDDSESSSSQRPPSSGAGRKSQQPLQRALDPQQRGEEMASEEPSSHEPSARQQLRDEQPQQLNPQLEDDSFQQPMFDQHSENKRSGDQSVGARTLADSDPDHQTEQLQPNDEPGCYGGLPFGLESCICEGAEVGEMAGLAACGRLFTECEGLAPFNSSKSGILKAVQRVCDTFAMDGCISAAQGVVVNNVGCAEILKFGTARCSQQQAWALFTRSVNRQCEPLCRDCPRLEEIP